MESTIQFHLNNFGEIQTSAVSASPAKRRCDSCNRRRRGCDKGEPCSGCRYLNLRCTYSHPAKRPKFEESSTADWTALHLAAKTGSFDLVQAFLPDDGPTQVNSLGPKKRTPLHLAVENGHVEIVRLLVYSGAHVNAVDAEGKTPLHLAAENGEVDVMRLLILEFGADDTARDRSNHTPLYVYFSRHV